MRQAVATAEGRCEAHLCRSDLSSIFETKKIKIFTKDLVRIKKVHIFVKQN
jgi:hypothetical protein